MVTDASLKILWRWGMNSTKKTWKLRRYYQSGGNSYVDGDEQYDKDLEVEAILPEWWEQRKIDDRREFCVNHQTQMTQWVAPMAVNLCGCAEGCQSLRAVWTAAVESEFLAG